MLPGPRWRLTFKRLKMLEMREFEDVIMPRDESAP